MRISIKNNGFTLIELLVVMSIIAVLSAILFPVFASVREKARGLTCLSNERQFGTAIMMYTQDYEDTYPLACTPTTDWTLMVQPYIKAGNSNGFTIRDSVFFCPSHPNTQQNAQYVVRNDVFPEGYNGSTSSPVVVTAAIDTPSSKIAIWEAGANAKGQGWGWVDTMTSEWFWTSNMTTGTDIALANGDFDQPGAAAAPWNGTDHYPRYRHNKTSNFLYLDGHVKSIVRGKLDWYKDIYLSNVCSWQSAPCPAAY